MRYARLVLAVLSLVAAPSSRLAAQGFEGVIVFEVHLFGPPNTVTQMTKGSKIRIEGMGGPSNVMILNADKIITLDVAQKKYSVRGVDDLRPISASEKHSASAVRTGKIENVAGVLCEVWHFKKIHPGEQPEESDVCVSKSMGFGFYRMIGGAAAGYYDAGSQAFTDAMTKGSGGIMRNSQNGSNQIVAVKVEAKSIPDAMFAPPSDYKLQ